MIKKARTEYYIVRTVGGDRKNVFAHSKPNYIEVSSRQKIYQKCFAKKFGPKYWSRVDVHMAMLTVVDDMLNLCFARTVTTVPTVSKAQEE